PAGSAFARGWPARDRNALGTRVSCIEGIGRQHVEPCFDFAAADAVAEVEDAASIAGACWLRSATGRRYGGSSGTNLAAALQLASVMRARGGRGAIVVVLGDRGERYARTLFDPDWRASQGHRLVSWRHVLARSVRTGAAPGIVLHDAARAWRGSHLGVRGAAN
ncbi:MAG: hypothetical protein ACREO3_06475, partial [Arenimonas sp.]